MDNIETPTTPARPIVGIDVYSDVVCPWCYIGKRRFEQGLASASADGDLGVDFEVHYKPYQLDPSAKPGDSGPVFDAYAKKFGGPEKAEAIIANVTETAAKDGLDFRMDKALRANTLLAHRVIWFADQDESPVTQEAVKERLLAAYFTDGVNIANPDALADCVSELGVDRNDVIAFLKSNRGVAEVAAELDEARDHGITAVPTYVFNDEWAVPGAQDAETFARVLKKMAATALENAAS